MNVGYQASKNRITQSIALTDEQAFRLRRMAADDDRKLSPFVGELIDAEWERRRVARAERTQVACQEPIPA